MKKQKIISGIITGSLVLAFLAVPVNATSLTEQLAQSSARQAAAKYQVDMTQNTIDGIQTELSKVNTEVSQISGQIDSINTDISALAANIAKTQEELAIAQAKKTEQEAAMSDRVRTMYMYGNGSVLEFLFSSTNFSDFVTKVDMSRYIIQADKDSLNALEETEKVINEKEQSIQADQVKTVEKKTEQEAALSQQEDVKAQKDQLLAQNQTVLTQYQAIEDSEAATSSDIEGQLQAYYAAQAAQATQVAQDNAASSGATDNSGSSSDNTGSSSGDATESGGGNTGSSDNGGGSTAAPIYSNGYQWPCGGEITSPFGYRDDPLNPGTTRYHSGVDIGASTGTAVACAGNGTVISAGWNGGYGNCVIVDIGNGLSAVYGHLSAINVSSGDTVSIGQTVGAVGSTGDSTGPHLHFEIRLYGTAVDPYSYI
ncbi:peptidoglycan DD-metalloendopeptidase family protein [Acetobacterium paludosum]|uniref:Peptidoglycan DD-metalloendopeptidase family protein n=1 Tax=Acetobacterium paludosum TaxID=52693 RepID=A0A923HZ53_9FIRM|nr:peptidoglycan DD-metalloendopeptidase family protein [Acetobacterium paludosum]MBC3888671.1 peptidoglycan DD-metalloendopeptidase family protein [Acetobacterium paludosum]